MCRSHRIRNLSPLPSGPALPPPHSSMSAFNKLPVFSSGLLTAACHKTPAFSKALTMPYGPVPFSQALPLSAKRGFSTTSAARHLCLRLFDACAVTVISAVFRSIRKTLF